jgi:hypothetical protein
MKIILAGLCLMASKKCCYYLIFLGKGIWLIDQKQSI